jgi:RNA polymerase sigma-70 factor (ECF subfamily)
MWRGKISEKYFGLGARMGVLMTTSESHDTTNLTRPSLLLRLRNPRDSEAWGIFVETYTPLVYAYCRRRGLQDSDVADVTQEVMAQVLRSIPDFTYQPERGRFRDWLGTITRTKLARFLSRNARAGKGEGGDSAAEELTRQVEAPESDTLWTEGFHARVLEVAMNRARPDFQEATWTIFEHAWVRGQAAPEVARELGVPIESVYLAKSRVLKRLRTEVVTLAEDYPPLLA